MPWFVAFIDGEPDFRVIRRNGFVDAVNRRKCWLCGQPMGSFAAFVVGPMCAVNRVSAEPPSHRECAEFAVRACPFLVRPQAARRKAKLPVETEEGAGTMIERNPGVTLLWISRRWKPFRDGDKGYLIDVGEPTETLWFREGRRATRAEILDSIESGLPLLRDMARQEGYPAEVELRRHVDRAMLLLPAA